MTQRRARSASSGTSAAPRISTPSDATRIVLRGRARLPPEPLRVPLYPLVERRPDRGLRDPRARARPVAGRHTRRRRAPARARPRAGRAGLELGSDPRLPRPFQRKCGGGDVPRSNSVRLEEDDVVGRLPTLRLADHDLLELVHLEPVEDALLDRLDEVTRFEPRLLSRVTADECGALENRVVELPRTAIVRADRA